MTENNGKPLFDLLTVRPLEPRPLVHMPSQIGLIWSAKSACTKVILWHFKICGLLGAAQFYDPWPHKFREEVLYNARVYQNWLKETARKELTWYQFFRDPVRRALSSYRHNVLYRYADENISRHIGQKVDGESGLSLNEFLTYLEQIDVTGPCDIHVKSQVHPLSDRAALFNIDEIDMYEAMNAIEEKHGLARTDFAAIPVFRRIDAQHNAKPDEGIGFDPDRRFVAEEASGAWPVTVQNLDAITVRRIAKIYEKDIAVLVGGEGSRSTGDVSLAAKSPP